MAVIPTTPPLKTTWDFTKEYALGDIVFYEGRQFISVFDGINLNQVPGQAGGEGYWTPELRSIMLLRHLVMFPMLGLDLNFPTF